MFTPEYHLELISQLSPQFPQGANFRIENWVQILGGADTTIWRFDFLYTLQDSTSLNSFTRIPMVVRIFQQGSNASQAQKEFEIMKKLHHAGISLPKTYCYSTSPHLLNKSYLVMDFIEGSLLEENFYQSSDEEKGKLLTQFLETMKNIHQFNWIKFFPEFSGELEKVDTLNCINQIISIPKNLIQKYEIKELIPLLEWLESKKTNVNSSLPVLIHGDFHPRNIIVNKQRKLVVLDWSNVAINDYRIDLAFLITMVEWGLGFELKPIIVNLYEQITSQKVNDIEFFMILSNFFNVLRIYSATHNHEITGENEESKNIFLTELHPYVSYLHDLINTETDISLKTLKNTPKI